DWLQHGIERIEALRPRRVLEIGCGSGMILRRLAPRCERYLGTDVSHAAVQRLRSDGRLPPGVELLQAPANDFSAIAATRFDTVVLNSVVQYFPGLAYLDEVIRSALDVIEGPGHVFIGDVRHHGLLEAFHLSVQLYRAPPELSVARLVARTGEALRAERELTIAPGWFFALQRRCPRISQVRVIPKQSAHDNEMSVFRYDVVMRVGGEAVAADPVEWIDCAGLAATDVLARLGAATAARVGLRQVSDRRVEPALAALALLDEDADATVSQLRGRLQARASTGLGCDDLAQWCAARGLAVQFSVCPRSNGSAWHAVVARDFGAGGVDWAHGDAMARAGAALANDPLQARRAVLLSQQLREHVRDGLPEYMVPAACVLLDAMPLTPNGKLDRKALPAADSAQAPDRTYEAPLGDTERRLAQLWCELLKLPHIGRQDHFFELGGHSLLAARLASAVRQALGLSIAVSTVFEHPVLRDLAQALGRCAIDALPPLTALPRTGGDMPLSFAQQRLWFLSRLDGSSAAYHVSQEYRLEGRLCLATLQRSLDRIVERHEALRTHFAVVGDTPVQRIGHAGAGWPMQEHDLTGCEDAAEALDRLRNEQAQRPFDLQTGPLIRAGLYRLSADEHRLVLTLHHIVADGWSLDVLTRELCTLYRAGAAGGDDPLPPLPLQYADHAAWQRRWLDGERLQQQANYWRGVLAGAPTRLELPSDRPRPARQDPRGASVARALDAGLAAALRALSQRHGVTTFMCMLAAWAVVLARRAGQPDLVIGMPVANRPAGETHALIGFFTNTVALRLDVSGELDVAELLKQVRSRTLAAQLHQDLPFEQVVERVNPVRSLAHTPLFQVAFN
ncbi:hypothetical protein BURC_00164, partial [Burkholderiaceae bacterium]